MMRKMARIRNPLGSCTARFCSKENGKEKGLESLSTTTFETGSAIFEKSTTDSTVSDKKDTGDANNESSIPEAPTNCCMSGCANCVWIVYSEDLLKIYKDAGSDNVRKMILSQIEDTNMRAFLSMELNNVMAKREQDTNKDDLSEKDNSKQKELSEDDQNTNDATK